MKNPRASKAPRASKGPRTTPVDEKANASARRERERAARRRAQGVAEDDDLTRVTLARVAVVVVRGRAMRRIRLRHFSLLFPLLFARVVRVRSGDAFASPSADDPPR